jgi:transcriptional regulator with XRE-family HTH domain
MQSQQPGGTIYAIGAVGTSWVKIGRTTAPVMQRLKTLQTGQPFPLQVLASLPVETDVHRIEKQVHAFLEAERRRGEWFAVEMDTPTLEALIVRAVEYLADHEAADEGDHPLRQILGERIHLVRRRSGLSQVELATRADISPTTLNRVELGRQKLYVDTLVTLARILGVSVDYLVGMTDDDRPRTLRGRQADADAPVPVRAVALLEAATDVAKAEIRAGLPGEAGDAPPPKRQRTRKAPVA